MSFHSRSTKKRATTGRRNRYSSPSNCFSTSTSSFCSKSSNNKQADVSFYSEAEDSTVFSEDQSTVFTEQDQQWPSSSSSPLMMICNNNNDDESVSVFGWNNMNDDESTVTSVFTGVGVDIPGILLSLGGSQTEEEAIQGIQSLYESLLSSSVHNAQQVFDLGGFSVIVHSLRRFQNSEDFVDQALEVLVSMTLYLEGRRNKDRRRRRRGRRGGGSGHHYKFDSSLSSVTSVSSSTPTQHHDMLMTLNLPELLLLVATQIHVTSYGIQEMTIFLFRNLAVYGTTQKSKLEQLGTIDIILFMMNSVVRTSTTTTMADTDTDTDTTELDNSGIIDSVCMYFYAMMNDVPKVKHLLLQPDDGFLDILCSIANTRIHNIPPKDNDDDDDDEDSTRCIISSTMNLIKNITVSSKTTHRTKLQLGTKEIIILVKNALHCYPNDVEIVDSACEYFFSMSQIPEIKDQLVSIIQLLTNAFHTFRTTTTTTKKSNVQHDNDGHDDVDRHTPLQTIILSKEEKEDQSHRRRIVKYSQRALKAIIWD